MTRALFTLSLAATVLAHLWALPTHTIPAEGTQLEFERCLIVKAAKECTR